MMDLQLFGGVFKGLFGGGSSHTQTVAAPSVKTAAPGSVATVTAESEESRLNTQKRLRRVSLNRDSTNVTQGALGNSYDAGAATRLKKQLGE